MLQYKCQLEGIKVIIREESYTSKCSFIDNEEICKHKNYLGKRIHRGLFISKEKRIINADLNGALNILRKEVPELQYGIEVCSTPVVYTIKK
jgi:putative transposase